MKMKVMILFDSGIEKVFTYDKPTNVAEFDFKKDISTMKDFVANYYNDKKKYNGANLEFIDGLILDLYKTSMIKFEIIEEE